MGIVVVAPLRATSQRDQATAAPPTTVMNSRRCTARQRIAQHCCAADFNLAYVCHGSIASGTSGDTTLARVRSPPKPDQNSERLRFARAALHRPQSSSASRFTAAHAGFFILSQSGERPER